MVKRLQSTFILEDLRHWNVSTFNCQDLHGSQECRLLWNADATLLVVAFSELFHNKKAGKAFLYHRTE
jgi:hypothetical protein